MITITTCRSSYSAAASPPHQKVTREGQATLPRITFDGHRARAETTIKIELNLKLTRPHPEQGDLRAGRMLQARQLSRKYSLWEDGQECLSDLA